jgi:hypothetical protein
MNEDDPLVLWQSLKDHLNQQKSGLDHLTLPRLYVFGSVQLCFTKEYVETACMWPEDH